MPGPRRARSFAAWSPQIPHTRAHHRRVRAWAAVEPVEFGLAASRITGAPLVIVAVEHGVPVMNEVVFEHDHAIARLRETLEHRGIHDPDIRVIDDSSGAGGLARAIEQYGPELIVLGVSRRGATSSKLLGTTAQRVINTSACPVAIVPSGYARPEGGVQTIGAAYAATDEGREALDAATLLAKAGGVRVKAIAVLHQSHAQDGGGSQDGLAAAIEELGPEVEVEVRTGDPAEELTAASQNVDLLVMGSRALGPKRAVVLGSVSRKVVAEAACPVLVLPRGAEPKSAALLADAEAQAARMG